MNMEKSIPEVLEEIFSEFKKVTKSEKIIKFKDYNVIEIEISGIMFGVGTTKDYSSMKIFEVKTDAFYEKYDPRKFKPIHRFGAMEGCGREKVWCYQHENEKMAVRAIDTHLLLKRSIAVLEISKLITAVSYAKIELTKK